MPTSIAICGAAGRMGRLLAGLAAAAGDLRLVGGIDRQEVDDAEAVELGFGRIVKPERAADIVAAADVVLDFSGPEGLAELLSNHREPMEGRGLVVGTTGLGAEVLSALAQAAARSPVLVSANFSVGVNLLLGLAEHAARALHAERYDVEIVEAHHRRKADAPSGTALAFGRAVAAGRGQTLDALRRDGRSGQTGERRVGEIGFHALRGGDVVGEHRVLFLGGNERIELVHSANDRALFGEGALLAARWIAGKPPGHYTMRQVLGV